MSTYVKTTAELAPQNASASPSRTSSPPKPASAGASPNPVCMEIPVRVRGLQAGAPAAGAAASAETFAEDTQTMILLPRGAVVRLAASVVSGQEVMLTDLTTQHHVHCKVVSVRPSETPRAYVELQFTHRDAKFLHGPASKTKPAPAGSTSTKPAAKADAERIAASLKTPGGAGAPSSFEATIQPALPLAAVKTTTMEDLPVRLATSGNAAKPAKSRPITLPLAAPQPRASMSASSPKLDIRAAKKRIGGDLHTGRKWILSGAVCAAVLLALAGGAYLFESRLASAASAPLNTNRAGLQASAANLAPQVITVRADDDPRSSQRQAGSATAISGKVGDAFRHAAAKLHLSLGASKIVAPSVSQAPVAAAAEEPPAISADESSAAGLAATANEIKLSNEASAPTMPAATPEPTAKVAAPATPPRAISNVAPQYPAAAKSAHIEGDVTIEADVDAAGNVTGMKVISGPAILQTAAQEALRQWKYEPAKLDGKPVAGQIRVTLRFLLH